jgi:hypothetical protein
VRIYSPEHSPLATAGLKAAGYQGPYRADVARCYTSLGSRGRWSTDEAQAWFAAFAGGGEFASGTRALDQAAPSLVPPILPDDLTPARQRAALGSAGQRPLPRLPLKIPARTPRPPDP